MKEVSRRINALFFLRIIFLITLVVGAGSFLVEGITLSFGDGHAFSEAGSVTVLVFSTVFGILKLLAIVLSAATFFLTMKINKECMAAFCVAVIAAILAICSGIFQYLNDTWLAALVLELISNIALAVSVFLLIDGIFEQKARKTPLFSFAVLGICLMVISAVSTFLSLTLKTADGFLGAMYAIGQVTYILYSVILFMAIHGCLKEISNNEESEVIE